MIAAGVRPRTPRARVSRTVGAPMALAAVLLVGCGEATDTGLANPASEYCVEQGGRVEIVTDADGGQRGLCVLPDGTVCDDWAFLRGECGPDGSGG